MAQLTRSTDSDLTKLLVELKKCRKCPNMIGPVVTHTAVVSEVYLIGQAPGPREGSFGRPFAWTAGKTLFKWFSSIGLNEEQFRSLAYMAAVCRCFPGKSNSGGDRVPSPSEIAACSGWMQREVELLKPKLIIPVGRLAIEQVMGKCQLVHVIGQKHKGSFYGAPCDFVPLPHPSGASSWTKMEPGKTLTLEALAVLAKHPQWQSLLKKRK